MYSLRELQHRIQNSLDAIKYPDHPVELYDPIRYMMEIGGKRIRPALMLMACDLFEGDIESALNPALGIEIFHNFTLMHDDIMDNAPLRRGKGTVHAKWGKDIAILSGDVMLVEAYKLMMEVDDKILRRVLSIFNETAAGVCKGQQLDMNFENRLNVNIEEYIHMIELKTAILLGSSLKIGALIGGSTEEEAAHLYEFGRNIGIAFQLQDDLLDVYGDPAKFGKQVGGDILSNKKTYLLVKALEMAEGKSAVQLQDWVSRSAFDPIKKIEAVKEIYDRYALRNLLNTEMKDFQNAAYSHLDALKPGKERKQVLLDFAGLLLLREQ